VKRWRNPPKFESSPNSRLPGKTWQAMRRPTPQKPLGCGEKPPRCRPRQRRNMAKHKDLFTCPQMHDASIGSGDYPCFAAWNVMRSIEGQKPTFEHRQWLGIGRLSQDSCRWLKLERITKHVDKITSDRLKANQQTRERRNMTDQKQKVRIVHRNGRWLIRHRWQPLFARGESDHPWTVIAADAVEFQTANQASWFVEERGWAAV
jgi:hypothetical protein